MKLPPELLDRIFDFVVSEKDAEEFYRAVFTDGVDSQRNANRFLQYCERKRWDRGGVAFVSSLPYNNMYLDEVRRIAAVSYDYSLTSADTLPREILSLYQEVSEEMILLKRCMQRLRYEYNSHDRKNPWIWKIDSRRRFEKAAQFLTALRNLLAMDSHLETWLEDMEGSVTRQSYGEYRRRLVEDDQMLPWWMLETDEEFFSENE